MKSVEKKVKELNGLLAKWIEFGVLTRNFIQLDTLSETMNENETRIFNDATYLLNETKQVIQED